MDLFPAAAAIAAVNGVELLLLVTGVSVNEFASFREAYLELVVVSGPGHSVSGSGC